LPNLFNAHSPLTVLSAVVSPPFFAGEKQGKKL